MSFGRSRVAEFHGPEQLVEASETLLDSTHLDMAVVRGAVDFDDSGIDRRALHFSSSLHSQAQEWLEEQLKLPELDKAVLKWWERNPNEDYELVGRIERIGSNLIDTSRHLDGNTIAGDSWYIHEDSLPGPISLSLRIDSNYGHDRHFYARRLDEEPRNRQTIPGYVLRLTGLGLQAVLPVPMSRVKQEPGDCVVFPNFPRPAIHQVKTKLVVGPQSSSAREAQALIHHYFVKPTPSASLSESEL